MLTQFLLLKDFDRWWIKLRNRELLAEVSKIRFQAFFLLFDQMWDRKELAAFSKVDNCMGLFRLCKTAVLNVSVILWDDLCMWAEGEYRHHQMWVCFGVFGTISKTFSPHSLIAYGYWVILWCVHSFFILLNTIPGSIVLSKVRKQMSVSNILLQFKTL